MRTLTRGHLRTGLDSLRGAKFRSFWTCLGVIIGVASVITVVSIGQGIKNQIGGQIHQIGQNLITVRPAQLHTGNAPANSNLQFVSGVALTTSLSQRDINTVARTSGVADSAPLTVVAGTVSGENGPYNQGFVIGTGQDLPGLINQSLSYGSFWTDGDGSNVAVV